MSTSGESSTSIGSNFTPMLMAPFFPGNMWGLKFKGKGSEINLTEWIDNIKSMFRMYKIPDTVQVDFILSHLEGEAKRQIMVVPLEQRDTAKRIFERLQTLYGDKMSISVLRSLCFSCRQESTETVSEFSLRLQELFKKLRQRDADSIRNPDALMRDQFVDGLQDKVLKRELRTLIRSCEEQSFADVYREACIRLEASGEVGLTACDAVGQVTKSLPSQVDLQKLKQELRDEMAAEIKNHMSTLSKGIVSELREELGLVSRGIGGQNYEMQDYQGGRRPSLPTSLYATREPMRPRPQRLHRYAADGRPICSKCNQPGHIQRHCQQRERSNSLGSHPLNP